jgi:hypothetical protein
VEGAFRCLGFDIEFWQEQGDEATVRAAGEMVELGVELKSESVELQKTVTKLKRL